MRDDPHSNILAWLDKWRTRKLFVSVITAVEIRAGNQQEWLGTRSQC